MNLQPFGKGIDYLARPNGRAAMERAVDQNDPPDAVAQRPIEVAAPRGRTIFRGKQGSGSVALQRRPKEHDRPHDRPAWRLCAACPIRRAFAEVRGIGSASCGESGGQYGEISVVAVSL